MPAQQTKKEKIAAVAATVESTEDIETVVTKRKFKPGTVALRRIRAQQKLHDPIVSRSPLKRLMHEALSRELERLGGFARKGKNTTGPAPSFHISPKAVEAMADMADAHCLALVAAAQKLASIDNVRITIGKPQMYLAAEMTRMGHYLPPRTAAPLTV
jgi:histone H3/H4